ncbi:putative uncharacterized protein DDB_G0282133 isoform X2 [Monomorium pharaonis]|uniref:putative uncharacterized protein DDB_G0282133 isoform X2 n=1 Tax=Monomorium pharaonis TaxID=307658 RepID=UPI001746D77E|nr:putative uncharacterized protein DDB_G0282133 isoform X2 [Monomorium pharaonis]
MPRPTKNLNNDFEPKKATRRMQTKMHIKNDVMNPPLRRSNRLKQNKSLPVSESSNKSVSSSRVTQNFRKRTATVNSQEHCEDTMKKLHTRKHSNHSKINEINVKIPSKKTLRKRTVNQSSDDANLEGTSTNTRAVRHADSKIQSTLPGARTTRKRKVNSYDTKVLPDQNKSLTGSPIKKRRQTSKLSLSSSVKEQSGLKEHERLDTIIIEATNNTNLEKETSEDSAKSDGTLHFGENEDNDFNDNDSDDSYFDDDYNYWGYDSYDGYDYWDDYDYDNNSDDDYWDDSFNNSSDSSDDDDENNEETDHDLIEKIKKTNEKKDM